MMGNNLAMPNIMRLKTVKIMPDQWRTCSGNNSPTIIPGISIQAVLKEMYKSSTVPMNSKSFNDFGASPLMYKKTANTKLDTPEQKHDVKYKLRRPHFNSK